MKVNFKMDINGDMVNWNNRMETFILVGGDGMKCQEVGNIILEKDFIKGIF